MVKDPKLLQALKTIRKMHGEDSIVFLGDSLNKFTISRWSSGFIDFDNMIGGGLPCSKIIELWGANQSGKTSFALYLASTVEMSVFIDAEGTLDEDWAKKLGVKEGQMIINQPNNAEEAGRIILNFVKADIPLIIVDSVPALIPQMQVENDIAKDSISPVPRYLSKLFQRLMPIMTKSKTTVIFINQVRDHIGIIFGEPLTTPGGHALKHYSSLRIEVRRKSWIGTRDNRIGQIVAFRANKSKISKPYLTCEIPLLFDKGFIEFKELKQVLKKMKVNSA